MRWDIRDRVSLGPEARHHGFSVQFSHSVMSDSLLYHGQHTRLPCPSLFPKVYSNSCPLSWWCHPTISSSVVPFSFHLQSFPASESFPVRWLFASGGQKIGASASASVLPMNIQIVFIFTQGSFLVPRSHSGFHVMLSHICRFEPPVFEPPVFSRPLAFPFCRATPALCQVTINLLWSIRKKPSPKIPSSSN